MSSVEKFSNLVRHRIICSSSQVEFGTTHKFMLVLERATQGSVLEFFDREFKKKLPYNERWELVCSALDGISSGLEWILRHNVVHR